MKLLFVLALAFVAAAYSDAVCQDNNSRCPSWTRYCKNNNYVKRNCQKTCGTCVVGPPTAAPTAGPPLPSMAPGACGVPQVAMTRVIAGKNAARGSWPWQILMMKNGRPGCGGTLINSRWVVTAGHCVHRSENSPRSFSVKVGDHDRNSNEGSEVTIPVERVIKHERYNSRNLDYDIALFKLAKPAQFNKWVQPACMPSADVPVGTECYITGWGKIRHPGSMHSYLQQAKMTVPSNKVCNAKNYPSIRIPITDRMVCGGGLGRISGCHGDSGGPFVCKINGKWELHGDVSHGSGTCDSSKTYTVFARTWYFKSWIESKMRQYGM